MSHCIVKGKVNRERPNVCTFGDNYNIFLCLEMLKLSRVSVSWLFSGWFVYYYEILTIHIAEVLGSVQSVLQK